MTKTPKNREYWLVSIDGRAPEPVRYMIWGDRPTVYPCGDEEGYPGNRAVPLRRILTARGKVPSP